MPQSAKGLPEKRREETGQGETTTRMRRPLPSPVTDPEGCEDRTDYSGKYPVALDSLAPGILKASPTGPLILHSL